MSDDPRPLEPCAHPSCGCRRSPFREQHCSAYCANADRDAPPEGACACGHATCVEAQGKGPPRKRVSTAVGQRAGRGQDA